MHEKRCVCAGKVVHQLLARLLLLAEITGNNFFCFCVFSGISEIQGKQ